jgi:hypothetical protein
MFRASGCLDLSRRVAPLTVPLAFRREAVPMAILDRSPDPARFGVMSEI